MRGSHRVAGDGGTAVRSGADHDTTAPPGLKAIAVTAVGAPGLLILAALVALAGTLATTVRTATASNAGTHSLKALRPC